MSPVNQAMCHLVHGLDRYKLNMDQSASMRNVNCHCVASQSVFVQLDFFIVCTSLLLIAAESVAEGFQVIKAFRVLRALKPLRTLTHSAGMLLVLKSVTLSMAAMANVSLLMFLVFVIFGVMGMQLFSGLLYR